MKIISIAGTRPEAIKMAPIIKRLARYPNSIDSKVVVTAQHREMMDQVLHLFGIKPEYDLNVMVANQSPNQVAAAIFSRLDPILKQEQPDWVLVQGDTTTTMTAAIAVFYNRIRLGHVEAGLRTHNKWNPFPEEINRRIATLTADVHFAPTETARQNLIKEHVNPENIYVTGNPVIDALQWVVKLPLEERLVHDILPEDPNVRVILLTAHRRENFGRGLRNICEAVRQICRRYGEAVRVVYPVHPNPNVLQPVNELLSDIPQVKLLPSLEYKTFVQLMAHSYLIMTDSGGIQEEAPSLGKPVLVLRETTERPEAIAAGAVRRVGVDSDDIVRAFVKLWENETAYKAAAQAVNPYGDGRAAERIVNVLLGEEVEELPT